MPAGRDIVSVEGSSEPDESVLALAAAECSVAVSPAYAGGSAIRMERASATRPAQFQKKKFIVERFSRQQARVQNYNKPKLAIEALAKSSSCDGNTPT